MRTGKNIVRLFGIFRKKESKEKIAEISEQDMYAFIEKWLDSLLAQKIPKNIVAFIFNLYDPDDNIWDNGSIRVFLKVVGALVSDFMMATPRYCSLNKNRSYF